MAITRDAFFSSVHSLCTYYPSKTNYTLLHYFMPKPGFTCTTRLQLDEDADVCNKENSCACYKTAVTPLAI